MYVVSERHHGGIEKDDLIWDEKGDSLVEVLMHCNLCGGSTWAIVAVTWAIVAVTWEIVANSRHYCPKKAICLGSRVR